jgi:hypothetical protein
MDEGGAGELPDFMKDPEIMAAMADPDTQAKLLDILSGRDPAKFMAAQQDPKLGPVLQKIMKSMAGKHGTGAPGAGAH